MDGSLNRPQAGITHKDSNNQAPLTARSDISSTANSAHSWNIEVTQPSWHHNSPGTGNWNRDAK